MRRAVCALKGALRAAFFITGAWLSRAAFDLPVNRHPGLRFGSYFIDIYPVNLILSSHGVCRRRAAFRSLSAKKGGDSMDYIIIFMVVLLGKRRFNRYLVL